MRMRCEKLFLKEFRNTSDDARKLLMISKLSKNSINELEIYLHSRIGSLLMPEYKYKCRNVEQLATISSIVAVSPIECMLHITSKPMNIHMNVMM